MPQNQITNNVTPAEGGLRPAIIADAESVRVLGTYMRHFFVGLADESSSCILICPPHTDTSVVGATPVEIISYPPVPGLSTLPPVIAPLAERLKRARVSLLHCISPVRMKLTAKLATILEVPYILSVNSLDSGAWRHHARGCAFITAPSESIADKARDIVKDRDKVHVARMGTFVSESLACYRESNVTATILMIEKLDRVRNFEPVFNAIKHLSIDGLDMVVALMGSGKAEGKVRRLISDLGLSHVINIVPEMRPLRHVFAGADIYVRATCRRRFDFSLLEAMSEGTAVAGCSDWAEELMRDGETAAVFEEGNELSINNVLGNLLRDREHARELARNGQELLRSQYKVSGMLGDMLPIYRRAVEEYRKGGPGR